MQIYERQDACNYIDAHNSAQVCCSPIMIPEMEDVT